MVNTPRTDTPIPQQRINALTESTGIRTRRSNPNAPLLSLERERGGVKVSVQDSATAGFTDTSSDSEDEWSDTNDAYSLTSDVPSLSSASTVPSIASSPASITADLPTYDELGELETQFSKLTISDAVPPPTESPVATTEDHHSDWSLAAQLSSPIDNPTVEQALSSPDADKWKAAMEEEVATLEKMGTYERTDLPVERNAIGNKWVLTIKRDENGIDFGQTFAPVVRLDSVRTIASLANHNDWDLRQLDVHSAYLNADVEEELYMHQIPYFQDGRMWNQLFDKRLKQLGYLPCKTDTCVYRRIIKVEDELFAAILAIHVDDIMVASSRNHTDFVIEELLREFDMRDLGAIRHFLGIAFIRERMQTAYPAHTPMTPNIQLTRYEGTKPKFNYGMYIAQFTTCFGPAHVTAVKHVIRYLKGTASRGITYRRSAEEEFGELGYSDADWGSNVLDHNLAALTLSVESQYHGRSKHIDIRHHFIRDMIQKRKVSTFHLIKLFMGEGVTEIIEMEIDE